MENYSRQYFLLWRKILAEVFFYLYNVLFIIESELKIFLKQQNQDNNACSYIRLCLKSIGTGFGCWAFQAEGRPRRARIRLDSISPFN